MTPVLAASPGTAPAGANPPPAARVVRAAREFEAVLLETLLGPLEESFSSLPGGEPSSGSKNYHHLGIEALARNLAAHGGLGIANMIVHALAKPEGTAAKRPMAND